MFFYVVRNEMSAGSDKDKEFFPIDPHWFFLYCHVYRHDVTKMSDFYNGGLWGIFSFFVGSD